MHRYREVRDDIPGSRGRSGPRTPERNRSSGIEAMGGERHCKPPDTRNHRAPLPRLLPQNITVSRLDARVNRANRGHRVSMGRKRRVHSSSQSPRRSRGSRARISKAWEEGEREGCGGSRGCENRKGAEWENRGCGVRGHPSGWENDRAEDFEEAISPQKEKESQQEGQKEEKKSIRKQSQWERQQHRWEQQQWGYNRLRRFRTPIPRRAQSQAAGEADPRNIDAACLGRDESTIGATCGRGEHRDDQTNSSSVSEVACDGKERSPCSEERELLTLGYAIDQLLQRNILGALDIMVQRVKAIELVLNGATWAVAQNIELVPLEQEVIASVAEAQGAAREFRHDSRVQREMSGKGPGKWRWTDEGKGKKGEGKKGEGKGGKWGGKRDQGPTGAARADPTKPQ